MKNTVFWIIILIIGCLACSVVAYRAGFARAVRLLGSDGDVYVVRGNGELHVQNASITNNAAGKHDDAKSVWRATFVMTIHALDQLRAGNTSDGIRKIESLCFASANMVFGDPVYRDDNISLLYASDLIQYRSKFRNNPAQWTPAETNLESILADWK